MSHDTTNTARILMVVQGTVQGVGFRPFVVRLARDMGVAGSVRNTERGVEIEIKAPEGALAEFQTRLRAELPPLASIDRVSVQSLTPVAKTESPEATGFVILPSSVRPGAAQESQVPPDVATCAACLGELWDPADPRYRYPFINCTDCGPRYTIIKHVPYDRPLTTMAEFKLCALCEREYNDIGSRRFHAQPVACPVCGPRVTLRSADGKEVLAGDAIARARELLEDGSIIAIKGLGGYHLACDAGNCAAVRNLRTRKRRPDRPLAVMVRDLECARRLAIIDANAASLLEHFRRPVVIVPAADSSPLCPEVGGSTSSTVGIMLPYTPLHHLLLEGNLFGLVMTSGNISGAPLAYENDVALQQLGHVADYFLEHDRPIYIPADDSVVRASAAGTILMRRSRGHVPQAITLPAAGPSVLAVGADQKATCCVTRGNQAILSQYVGDLANPDALALLRRTITRLQELFEVRPDLIVHDLHPDYHSTRLAEELATNLPCLAVQHHHAHALSCLAEHRSTLPAIAVVLDGHGFGTDGAVWGGEVLHVDGLAMQRLGHLAYVPIPGGDLAAREPLRMALAYGESAFGAGAIDALADRLQRRLAAHHRDLMPASTVLGLIQLLRGPSRHMIPRTSSAGRLFDAVAAWCGLRARTTFEGQAAMELEDLAACGSSDRGYSWVVREPAEHAPAELDLSETIRAIDEDLATASATPSDVALSFHIALCAGLVEMARLASAHTGCRRAILSGGVMQNALVLDRLRTLLSNLGFIVMTHSSTPPNDGGIALGQAWAGLCHHFAK